MKKLLAVLSVAALVSPALAFAAYNDVALATNVILSVNGIELDVSGSQAAIQSIIVNDTSFDISLLANSTFQVTAPGLNRLSASTLTGVTTNTGVIW